MSEMSRLKWLCRRGVKELDVVLTSYLNKEYPNAAAQDREVFRQLLELEDPTLWAMLIGQEPASSAAHEDMLARLRQTCSR